MMIYQYTRIIVVILLILMMVAIVAHTIAQVIAAWFDLIDERYERARATLAQRWSTEGHDR